MYCEEPHYSASCEKVVDSDARKVILRDKKPSFNCLRKGHHANTCQNTKPFRHCEGRHHQSICSKTNLTTKEEKETTADKPKPRQDGETNKAFCGAVTLVRVGKGSILLQTARAIATNGSKSISVRILFDTGSQRSYVTNTVINRLNLNPVKRETLHLNTFGNSKSKRQDCELFKLNIRSKKGENYTKLRAINFPTICSPVNSQVNIENYPYLNELELADFDPNAMGRNNNIDILVGADFSWDIVTGEVIRKDDSPTAISSKLGWLLSGPSTQTPTDISTNKQPHFDRRCIDGSCLQTDHDDKLTTELKRFWETESMGIESIDDPYTDGAKFLRDIRFTGKRYEVGLPWKEDCPAIESDYDLCHNHLKLLHQNYRNNPSCWQNTIRTFKIN